MNKLKITYLITLILLSVLPINGTHSALNNNYILHIRWDYFLHALVYIPLYPLLYLSMFINNKEQRINKPVLFIKQIGIAISIAASLEAIQLITPWRTFNVNDLISNVLGVGIGVILWFIFRNRIILQNSKFI